MRKVDQSRAQEGGWYSFHQTHDYEYTADSWKVDLHEYHFMTA